MSIADTKMVARIAAGIAGLGLVLTGFAPALQAQTATTTASTAVMFSRDLTLGSTGADVTALQNWLITKGFTIPAGATGYFGAQTKAALASYQAANGIVPAAGYFGPVTRAKVNASGSTTPPSDNSGAGTSVLHGGETDLTKYDLRSEDSEGSEGESNVKLATAKFDVEDADARIERAELTVQATGAGSALPWKYFDTISVYANGKRLASETADRKADWDKTGSTYTITLSGLNYVVREGDQAELTFVADMNDGIDSANLNQQFNLWVADRGIRAVDGVGIQQYVGKDSDTVKFGFAAEKNGDLSIRDNNDNPDASVLKVEASKVSDEYDVFVFDVRNSEDADSVITKLTIDTSLTGATSTASVVRNAVLTVDGDDYRGDIENADDGSIVFDDLDIPVDGKDTVTFKLAVKFAALNNHYLSGDQIRFTVDGANIEAEGADSGDNVTGISGSAESETFTLSTTGLTVSPKTTSASVTTPSGSGSPYATYTIKFSVTADEDNPIYIAKTAASSTNASAGAVYNILKDGAVYDGALDVQSAVLSSTSRTSDDAYVVRAGKTETFTLTVTLDPSEAGFYAIELGQVHYGLTNSTTADQAYDVNTNNAGFETDVEYIPA